MQWTHAEIDGWNAKAWKKLHVPPFSPMKLWIPHLNKIYHVNFRFSIQSLFDLKTVFSALGIRDAFDPITANFKGISGKRFDWIKNDHWPNSCRLWHLNDSVDLSLLNWLYFFLWGTLKHNSHSTVLLYYWQLYFELLFCRKEESERDRVDFGLAFFFFFLFLLSLRLKLSRQCGPGKWLFIQRFRML